MLRVKLIARLIQRADAGRRQSESAGFAGGGLIRCEMGSR